MLFAKPFFVTSHAVRQWRKRIDPRANVRVAQVAIQAALQAPVFQQPTKNGATLYGCRDARGAFIAVVAAPRQDEGDWPAVITIAPPYYWHEARKRWRAIS